MDLVAAVPVVPVARVLPGEAVLAQALRPVVAAADMPARPADPVAVLVARPKVAVDVPVVAVVVHAARPRVPSVAPVAPRGVVASPSGPVVKSSNRCRHRPSEACAYARVTGRPFACPAVRH